jgi:hypothetical protein
MPHLPGLSRLFLVSLLAQLLNQPGGIVDGCKGAPGSHDALVHEVSRDDDPEGIHQDKVAPVIVLLRTRVRQVEDVVVKERSGVVQDVAVELAERDNELGRVAERVVDGDEVGSQKGAGAPEYL